MRPRRTAVLVIGLALVAAACGGGAAEVANSADTASTVESDASTTSTPSTEPAAPPSTEQTSDGDSPAAERPAPDPNRTLAPDFSLALGDGSTFVLSAETRPVFMVFWAEW